MIVGGVFDLFDGTLARATGRASKLGAFYDSVFDRWGESLIFLGVAAGCVAAGFAVGAVLAGAAMASAFMVGYARAKSELLGFTPGTGMAGVGLAPREVRLVILTVGLVAVGLLDPTSTRPALGATLGLIAVLATITSDPANPPRPRPGSGGLTRSTPHDHERRPPAAIHHRPPSFQDHREARSTT